jgi:hypothetical protein
MTLPSMLWDQGNWTWDTLVEAAKKLVRVRPDGSVERWGYGPMALLVMESL